MTADVPVKQSSRLSSCCAVWKEKCSKLEAGRKHLRQAVQILTEQVDKIQAENLTLKNAYEEEKARAGAEEVEKEKALAARVASENEISALNSEISSLKQKGSADVEDRKGEVKLLQDRVSKAEKEIARLKSLLDKEKARADSEKKNAEAQKKSASEAWKLMKAEKVKADNERKVANSEGKKAEEYRLQLERLRKEAEGAKSKLVSETSRFEEVVKRLEAEKDKVTEERKHSDSEISQAEEQRRLAETNEKKFMEEKSRAGNLSQQLEDARRKIEELQNEISSFMFSRKLDSRYQCDQIKIHALSSEISSLRQKGSVDVEDKTREEKLFQDCISEWEKQISHLRVLLEKEKEKAEYIEKAAEAEKASAAEAWKCAKVEKAKADEVKKNLDIERKKAENYWVQLEAFRKEANQTKAKFASEVLQLEKAMKQLEREKHQNFEEVTEGFEGKKQKSIAERKHTDIGLREAEEQRKLVEMNRKMALEEKCRADQLSCQLEESRHKVDELQKQIHELKSSITAAGASTTLPNKGGNGETRNMKILEQQLKLEKMRLKYVKQVTKLEKNRNGVLRNELGRIKMDSIQISRRLNALDKWLLSGIDYREDMEEANVRRSKLKRKVCDLEPFPMYAQTESELLKANYMAVDASDPPRKILCSAAPAFPMSGGNFTAFVSGTDSKLRSLDGGSSRELLQSSVMNSSSASFSDGQLAGSQEGGALVSTTSEKWVEENDGQTISCMSGEVTKTQHNENLAVVAENSVRIPHNRRARKFKRVLDAIESVENLYSEGKKLHMQMEEKLSVLHGMLNREIGTPMEELKYLKACEKGDLYANHQGGHNKRKAPSDEGTILQHLCSIDEQGKTTQIRNGVHDDANAHRFASSSAIDLGLPQECVKELSDILGSDIEHMEKIDSRDYMKLLDLDNTEDEECYRRAIEMPLSPTLPEITVPISSTEGFDIDRFKLADKCSGGLSNEKEVLVPSHGLDIIDLEISSNDLSCNASVTSDVELLHKNEGLLDSFEMLGNGNGCCNAVERTSIRQSKDSEMVEMPNISISSNEGLNCSNISSESKICLAPGDIPAYCVVFSDNNDCRSVSRVFCATRNCAVRCSLDTKRECMVQEILHAIKMEEKILPREKACTLFTLLLLNFCWCTSIKSESCVDNDFFLCLDSFACQIIAVLSDAETIRLFAELCCLDELVGLIEDFLINGLLLVHSDASPETLTGCDSKMNIFLDGICITLSSAPASTDHLVGGSTILASVCAAIDHIEFICEASYNLLRIQKCDTDVLLTILHVFAYLCGDKFFSLKQYNLTMTVLKSIIVSLEGKNSSILSPSHKIRCKFLPCAKCPFDAVSEDMVISLLLEKLHSSAFSVTMHQHLMESANLSNFHVLCHKDNDNQSSSHEQVLGALDVNSAASSGLNNCVTPSSHSNSVGSGTSFDFSDVLSLVELVSLYMSWEWTCDKVIPVLLEILEGPMLDDFAVAIVVLLGQLGRFGVAACGFEDKEIENLKSKLSGFLSRDSGIMASLPVQIATITSLLGLLRLDFEDVLSDHNHSEIASQSVYVDPIRKWFSTLSKEQKSFSCSLLQSTAAVTS